MNDLYMLERKLRKALEAVQQTIELLRVQEQHYYLGRVCKCGGPKGSGHCCRNCYEKRRNSQTVEQPNGTGSVGRPAAVRSYSSTVMG